MKVSVKILDRYVVSSFLYSYLLCFLVLMGLRIAADLFVNMDEFVKQDTRKSVAVDVPGSPADVEESARGSVLGDIVRYYSFQSLVYFQELGGVIVVAAAAFSLARMNQTNELTAILASGVSLHRVIWPILLVGAILSGLSIINQEVLIPRNKDKLVRDRDDIPGTQSFQVRLPRDSYRNVWYSDEFVRATGIMRSPMVLLRDPRYKASAKISAGWAKYEGQETWAFYEAHVAIPSESSGRSGFSTEMLPTWLSPRHLAEVGGPDQDGRIAAIDDLGGLVVSVDRIDLDANTLLNPRFDILAMDYLVGDEDQPVLVSIQAESAIFAQPNRGPVGYSLNNARLLLTSDLTPDELALRQSSRWLEYMSSAELGELLETGKLADPIAAKIAKHSRFTEPLANIVMLLLGLPFILSRERNIKASASLCLAVVGACYVTVFLSRYLGAYGLDATLAAWLPILVFGPVGVVMLDTVKT